MVGDIRKGSGGTIAEINKAVRSERPELAKRVSEAMISRNRTFRFYVDLLQESIDNQTLTLQFTEKIFELIQANRDQSNQEFNQLMSKLKESTQKAVNEILNRRNVVKLQLVAELNRLLQH